MRVMRARSAVRKGSPTGKKLRTTTKTVVPLVFGLYRPAQQSDQADFSWILHAFGQTQAMPA